MFRRCVFHLVAFLALILFTLSPAKAQNLNQWKHRWQVNGNGYVGLLVYNHNPANQRVKGLLLGTGVEGFQVGRRLILHRYPQGRSQIWEGWVMDPRLGAHGQAYYSGQAFIAGTISENKAGNSLYPWYAIPLGVKAPWKPGGGSGGGSGGTGGGGGANLLINGSFEQGRSVGGNYLTVRPGSADLPGWQVTGNSVDVVATAWQSAHGKRALDMNGTAPGGVRQSFTTIPGKSYRVSFDLAGNPWNKPLVKILHVEIPGIVRKTYRFDIQGKSARKMGWVRKGFTFRAAQPRSTIHLFSNHPPGNGAGPALDRVMVTAVP